MTDKQHKLNLNSNKQVSDLLFNFMELESIKETKGGSKSVDEEAIKKLAEQGNEFCSLLSDHRKLSKALSTYLKGLKNLVMKDGKIHPDFWLNIVETFRSSSSNPNFQNIPKHGDIIEGIPWKIIRELFTKLNPGWLLGEVDYSSAEVRVVAKISDDPVLIDDLNNGLDMHSYWANVIFGLGYSEDELIKVKKDHDEERFLAKNNFTFANIYGAMARSIANEMVQFDFYLNFLKSKFDKLKNKGNWNDWLTDESERHMQECQDYFYNRYNVLKDWQDNSVSFYYKNGYVPLPLGFRRHGPLKRNEIINTPIQGTAFHLLLSSLIRIEKELTKKGFKSHIIGQIHDSIMFNMKNEEVPEVMELVNDIMVHPDFEFWNTGKIVQLDTDWDLGHNWTNMKSISLTA